MSVQTLHLLKDNTILVKDVFAEADLFHGNTRCAVRLPFVTITGRCGGLPTWLG